MNKSKVKKLATKLIELFHDDESQFKNPSFPNVATYLINNLKVTLDSQELASIYSLVNRNLYQGVPVDGCAF